MDVFFGKFFVLIFCIIKNVERQYDMSVLPWAVAASDREISRVQWPVTSQAVQWVSEWVNWPGYGLFTAGQKTSVMNHDIALRHINVWCEIVFLFVYILVPVTGSTLAEQRHNLALELLWVQQAIHSRKQVRLCVPGCVRLEHRRHPKTVCCKQTSTEDVPVMSSILLQMTAALRNSCGGRSYSSGLNISINCFTKIHVRLHSHRHECESEYPYMCSSKHEFACISVAAVHIDTSSVRVRVTCEFHSYEFLCRSCFYSSRMKWATRNLY